MESVPLSGLHGTPVVSRGGGVPDRDARDRAVEDHAATALARPVFSASRRPVPAPLRSAATSAGLPRLSGIIIVDADRRAIFAGEKPMVGRPGDRVGRYRILAIRPTDVTVQGDTGTELLQLGFGDRASRPATGSTHPNLLEQLNNAPPPEVKLPGRANLMQMLAHLPKRRG